MTRKPIVGEWVKLNDDGLSYSSGLTTQAELAAAQRCQVVDVFGPMDLTDDNGNPIEVWDVNLSGALSWLTIDSLGIDPV